ncbi:MAG: low molecular weight phosphotyrosine protein phosphatase [Lachnospiraceae bacterium]|nr:low molecular weight phosphotyrosine protein phosphatase [Lachnospiraceae bacterium]
MIKILFVCHGNICRSPIAEFVMKDLVKKNNLDGLFYIESAATSTEEIWNGVGNPVYPPAAQVLRQHGIRGFEQKRARQLSRADYERFDLLIGMDRANLRNMERMCGHSPREGKIRLLLDYTDRAGHEVSDPWYTRDFETAYRDIEEGCLGLLRELGYA